MYSFILHITAAFGVWLGMATPYIQLPALIFAYPAGCFLLALTAQSHKQAFQRGLLSSMAGFASCLYWLIIPLQEQANFSWIQAAPVPLLLGGAIGMYSGIFCLVIYHLKNRLSLFQLGILSGLTWAILEYARGYLFSGFPWLPLAAAFVPWPIALQPLSFIGAYAYSGVITSIACWGAGALHTQNRQCGIAALATIVLCSSVSWYTWRLPTQTISPVRISMVQGNIDQGQKWIPAYQSGTVSRYITMSQGSLEKLPADLLIWPETSMPFYLQEEKAYREKITALVQSTQTPLLLGAPAYKPGTDGRKWDIVNRAYLMTPERGTNLFYDKEHLVPFGEYTPSWLSFMDSWFSGPSHFTPGTTSHPLVYRNIALGVLICYETIFPELVQSRVEQGANLLVNISNDAWFEKSAAAKQHLHMAVLRAVEQNRYIARGTNTGISAIITPKGKITAQGGMFRAEVLSETAATVTQTTLFHKLYPYILPTLTLCWCGIWLYSRKITNHTIETI